MTGVLLWLVRAGNINFFPALGCSNQPSTEYNFSPANTFFTLLVPIAQQSGQAGVLGRLSLCVSEFKGTVS